jgi:hypothetical protein
MNFSITQQNALLLAGTVALPSPIPAIGQVWVVIISENGENEFYIKIVQVVSDKRIITRFVRLADVRAIRTPAADAAERGPENWPLITFKELRRRIDKKVGDLPKKEPAPETPVEIKLYEAAIVYVPEAAPALHRDEVGVTAAVSAEDVGFSGPYAPCCHREFLSRC